MKKTALILGLLALLLAACGGGAATEQQPTQAPPAEQPTEAPTQTPEPEPSDTPEPTVDPAYQAAQAYQGEWSGSWTNKTFGSSGDVTASIQVQEDGVAEFTVDLGGMVFGMVDPDPMTYTGTFDQNGATFEAPGDPLFGDLTINLDSQGNVAVLGDLIPVAGIARLEASGTLSPQEMRLDYTVFFAGGGEAVGEMLLTR